MYHQCCPARGHKAKGNRCLCSIIPPHIFEHIEANARDKQLRDVATRALQSREEIQDTRELARVQSLIQMAAGGALLATTPRKKRIVYTAEGGLERQAALVREEGSGPSADIDANEAYDYAGTTWDFYYDVFGRNSLDDAGLELISTVHLDPIVKNAFWDGSQMVYCDGTPNLFNRFTIAIDIVGHELTHGVTQYTASLVYRSQSGALNESISDVFGSLVKQKSKNHKAEDADWLIGEGLFVQIAGRNRKALRSMKDPGAAYDDPDLGRDPQPRDMSGYRILPETRKGDYGGVHINSGIPNRAFYLVAIGLGGFAWEKAGRIWYDTLTKRLDSHAQFSDMRAVTIESARTLFGASEADVVKGAWEEVGVK